MILAGFFFFRTKGIRTSKWAGVLRWRRYRMPLRLWVLLAMVFLQRSLSFEVTDVSPTFSCKRQAEGALFSNRAEALRFTSGLDAASTSQLPLRNPFA